MVIYIISDGKKGHLSQTRGLAQALIKQADSLSPGKNHSVHEIEVSHFNLFSKLTYKGQDITYPKPDIILCAGHGTHITALRLARRYHCPSLVCMKPSLPLRFFSLCIVPRHDFPEKAKLPDHVLLTNGAINTITPTPDSEKKETLLLIGGPSKEFGWDEDHLLTQLSTIARYNAGQMVLTTSRRTPKDFVQAIASACPSIRVEPVETTGSTWVADHLTAAREVWATQDSVSMVYEAVSSGAPVGVIEMPVHPKRARKEPSRVARGLANLVKDGYVTTYTSWLKNHQLTAGPTLHEADRAAEFVLKRYPDLLS